VSRAELSVLRAASLVLRVVATIGLSAVPLSSTAEFLVVGAELLGWVVALAAAEVPSDGAESLFVEARLCGGVIARSIAESVGCGWANVVVDASESRTVYAAALATEVDTLASTLRVVLAGLTQSQGDEKN